jgi:hypothetical protein
MECSNPGQILLARPQTVCMMHRAVRGLLTGTGGAARPTGQARAALLLLLALGLSFSACAGGQSGSEGLCGESDGKRETEDVFTTAAGDEDGGVEEEPDAAQNEFVADDGQRPEAASGPTQCVPTDGKEY